MATIEQQNQALRAQIQQLIADKQATLTRVQVKLSQLIAEKNQMAQLVAEREARNTQLMQQLQSPDRPTDAAGMNLDQLRQRVAELEHDRGTLQQKIKARLSGLISEKHLKTQRIRELEQRQVNPAELQNLRDKIQDLSEERTELTQKINDANAELQNVQAWLQENQQLREQLDQMMVESRSIQQQITDIQQKADKSASEIHEFSNQIAQLEEMNLDYEKKIQELKTANRSASQAVTENTQLRAEVAALSQQKATMTKQLQAHESSSKAHASQASKELTALRAMVGQSEAEMAELQQELQRAQASRDQSLEAADKLNTQKTTLLAEKKGLQTQMQQMQRKADIDAIENEQYERTLKEITESKDLLMQHIKELEAEIKKGEEWDKQNAQLRNDMQVLREENAALEQTLSQLEKGFETSTTTTSASVSAILDENLEDDADLFGMGP